jgi:hypothetical protein
MESRSLSTDRYEAIRVLERRRRQFYRQVYSLLAMGFGHLSKEEFTNEVVQGFTKQVDLLLRDVEKTTEEIDQWRSKGVTVALKQLVLGYDRLMEGRISDLLNLRREFQRTASMYQAEAIKGVRKSSPSEVRSISLPISDSIELELVN